MAARPWPALTKKGTDCRLCREKGDGVFCHHHAGGGDDGSNLPAATEQPADFKQWFWVALRALRFVIYCFLGILAIDWGLLALESRLLGGFPSIFVLKSNPYRCSSVTPRWNTMQIAYHEAGHALVAIKREGAYPIKQVTIVRGWGYNGNVLSDTWNRTSTPRKQIWIAAMDMRMGARAAEELIFGFPLTSTDAPDTRQARSIARSLVTDWGKQRINTPAQIDREVKAILGQSHNRTKELLMKCIFELHWLASALMDYKTLTGREINDLLAGKPISKAKCPWEE